LRVSAGSASSPVDPADILGRARGDTAFSTQSGWGTQVMNTYYSCPAQASQLEAGIFNPNVTVNGSTRRFGKEPDPAGGDSQVLAFRLHPSDPTTSGSQRAEISFTPNIEFDKVYWVAVAVYVNFSNPSSSDNTSLFGTQVHATEAGHSPSFSLYMTNGGANFEVQARYETSNGDVTVHKANQSLAPLQGQWTKFVFQFRHNLSGNGFLKVWMNGTQIVNYPSGTESGMLGFSEAAGTNDYAKFGYYNWGNNPEFGGNQFTVAREVWLRSPVVVKDQDDASKYTEAQIRALLN